jgi:hypothetical protein
MDSFITYVQMAIWAPSLHKLFMAFAHEHEKSFVSEKAWCTSNQISTRSSLHT